MDTKMLTPAANMPALSMSTPIPSWLPIKASPPIMAKNVATGNNMSILTKCQVSSAALKPQYYLYFLLDIFFRAKD